MASPELQPAPPRGPEIRPNTQPVQTHEGLGRRVEAAPAPANLSPAPSQAPPPSPAGDPQPVATISSPKRSSFSLGRSTPKPLERSDASKVVYIDRAQEAVSENREDPAAQKDEISSIKEDYLGFKESGGD